MVILRNISLAPYTTFHIGGPARFFCVATNETDIVEAIRYAREQDVPFFTLGGGSNLLISDRGYAGLVIKNEIAGIDFEEQEQSVLVRVGAGFVWDSLVLRTVRRGLYGLENLSNIPGTVGAAPVQNIGAYGVEVGNCIDSVRAFDTRAMKFVDLTNEQCRFEYRDSYFKKHKGRHVITRVTFRLSKKSSVKIGYKDLTEYFAVKQITQPSLSEVRRAVVTIRRRKLPNWKTWGTAGSFFKNPVISQAQYDRLKKANPELPGFPTDDGRIKVQLGWILDKLCKARGLQIGNVGTFEKQALVVVAKPGANAEEVVAFTTELMNSVKQETGITIKAEVEWVAA